MDDRDVFQVLAGVLTTCQPHAFYPSDLKKIAIRARGAQLEPRGSRVYDGASMMARMPSLALFANIEHIVGTENQIQDYLVNALSKMFATARAHPDGRARFRRELGDLGCMEFHRGTEKIAAAVDKHYGLGDDYDSKFLNQRRESNKPIVEELRQLAYEHGMSISELSWILREEYQN